MEEKTINETEFVEGGEIEQQPEDHPMNALLEEALSFRRLKRGDIVEGTIVSVTPTEVLVDVSAKSEGVVPAKELERLGREGLDSLDVGARIHVYVVRPEDRDGDLILSIRRAEEETDWKQAQERFEAGEHFESEVAGFNKGGLIIRLGKLRGFVPASQLSPAHQGSGKLQPEERWARLVGTTLHVKIIELDRKRKRLILSERAALRFRREAEKERLLSELRVGEVRTGTVSSLTDFGAFVDLGGADGLIHLSELSWNRSAKPRDVLSRGQEVEVYILNVDRDRKRIALSLKRLEPEPWTTVESRYYVGQLVEGKITRLANFGAFALVNDEIEGLIHISELSSGRINNPQEVVQEGEQRVMRIIRIDPRRRRMGLSLRRVTDPAYADLDWRAELAAAEASFEGDEAEAVDESADEVEASVTMEAEDAADAAALEPTVAEEPGATEEPVAAEVEEVTEAAAEEPVVAEEPGATEEPVVAEVEEVTEAVTEEPAVAEEPGATEEPVVAEVEEVTEPAAEEPAMAHEPGATEEPVVAEIEEVTEPATEEPAVAQEPGITEEPVAAEVEEVTEPAAEEPAVAEEPVLDPDEESDVDDAEDSTIEESAAALDEPAGEPAA